MTRRKLVALLATLVALSSVLSGCGFKGLYSASLPGGADLGDKPFTMSGEFTNVLDLVPQSAVKVNDVAVGKVLSITLKDQKGVWLAQVKMAVNKSVKLPSNARASILQTSLLGEKYVSLQSPATNPASTNLTNGSQIPLSRTNSAPEVEQVLGALSLVLNEGGLRQIKSIAIELNKALGSPDRQSAARDLIGQLDTFVGTLDNQKSDITNALDSINRFAATLNQNKTVLTNALDTFPAALRVLSKERGKLVTLLTSLSQLGVVANRVINATQTQVVQSLKNLDPVIRRLTAVGDDLPKSLRIIGTFPFPLGLTRQFVKGDYANLNAIFNLNVTDVLCGAIGLCANGASAGALKTGLPILNGLLHLPPVPLPGLNSEKAMPLSPMLVGSGK